MIWTRSIGLVYHHYLPVATDRLGFPSGSAMIESACIAGDAVLIPRSEQSSARGHGNPLQYSAQTWTHSLAT